jgi:hypothetical protein
MDAHFGEYVAAVQGMQEVYGERADCLLSEFHLPVQEAELFPVVEEYLGV